MISLERVDSSRLPAGRRNQSIGEVILYFRSTSHRSAKASLASSVSVAAKQTQGIPSSTTSGLDIGWMIDSTPEPFSSVLPIRSLALAGAMRRSALHCEHVDFLTTGIKERVGGITGWRKRNGEEHSRECSKPERHDQEYVNATRHPPLSRE